MGLISNGTTIFDAGALDSGVAKGAMTFIKKLTEVVEKIPLEKIMLEGNLIE